jgi:outer membrane protein assembly factor BamB
MAERIEQLSRELADARAENERAAHAIGHLAKQLEALGGRVPQTRSPRGGPRTTSHIALVGVAIGVSVLGVAGAMVSRGRSTGTYPQPINVSPIPLTSTVFPAPATTAPAFGVVRELVRVDGGEVIVVSRTNLARVNSTTLAASWSAPIREELGFPVDSVRILPRGGELALVSANGAFFHSAETGHLESSFFWNSQIKPSTLCAAGATQLQVQTAFDGLIRLDAATGKKATSGPSCALVPFEADVRCEGGQECGSRSFKTPDLDCDVYLQAGKATFRPCNLIDGTRRRALVAFATDGTIRWETPRESDSERPGYFAAVGNDVVLATTKAIEVYSATTGERRWSRPRQRVDAAWEAAPSSSSLLAEEGHRLLVGDADTLLAIDLSDGQEVGRLRLGK